MKLRFETSVTLTDRPGEFRAGRVIEVTSLTSEMQRWLDKGICTVVREDPTETATAPALPEKAVAARLPSRGRASRGSGPKRRSSASEADPA